MERRTAMCDALAAIYAWVCLIRLIRLRRRMRQLQFRAGGMIVVERVSGLRSGQKQTYSEAEEYGCLGPSKNPQECNAWHAA
jgi:hypothetical protein